MIASFMRTSRSGRGCRAARASVDSYAGDGGRAVDKSQQLARPKARTLCGVRRRYRSDAAAARAGAPSSEPAAAGVQLARRAGAVGAPSLCAAFASGAGPTPSRAAEVVSAGAPRRSRSDGIDRMAPPRRVLVNKVISLKSG
eukprot:SAG31_NODE_1684_length_7534_cov_6.461870_4_plen_142_part_00